MKWFKHYTDASDNDFIEAIEEEFGMEGYARWWKLCEIVGRSMGPDGGCSAKHPWSKWQTFLKAKRKKLETFLVHLQNQRKIKLVSTGNILEISIPKMLELRDEYCRKSGHAQENVAPDTEEDTDKEKKKAAYVFSGKVIRLVQRDFDAWQNAYHFIPDLRAELTAIDDKLFSSGETGGWFQKVSAWLRSKHERLARAQAIPWSDRPDNRMPSPAGG